MRFKCDYSDSIDETFKMIMPITNKKDELIHPVVYIKLNRRKNFIKNIIFKLKKMGWLKKLIWLVLSNIIWCNFIMKIFHILNFIILWL